MIIERIIKSHRSLKVKLTKLIVLISRPLSRSLSFFGRYLWNWKSRIVRELARACWDVDSPEYNNHKPKNFEMIQVKPNWHDSSELIGYVSRLGDEPTFIAGDF